MNEAFNKLTKSQQMYVESIREIGGEQLGYDLTKTNWTRKELVAVSMIRQSNDDVPNWIVKDGSRRISRGVYHIPEIVELSDDHETVGDALGDTVVSPVQLVPHENDIEDSVVTAEQIETLNYAIHDDMTGEL